MNIWIKTLNPPIHFFLGPEGSEREREEKGRDGGDFIPAFPKGEDSGDEGRLPKVRAPGD